LINDWREDADIVMNLLFGSGDDDPRDMPYKAEVRSDMNVSFIPPKRKFFVGVVLVS